MVYMERKIGRSRLDGNADTVIKASRAVLTSAVRMLPVLMFRFQCGRRAEF